MNLKPLLIFPPLALAAFGFYQLNQPEPVVVEPREEPRLAVRTQVLTTKPVTVSTTGFGRVQAVRDWTAVAEVQGRIVKIQQDLAVGSIVEAGSLLFAIDASDYQLALEKVRANIASVEAQLAELERQEVNTQASLEVTRDIQRVAEVEFHRIEELLAKGTATQANLDTARKALLNQTVAVTNLSNSLALFPSKRQSLEANLLVRKADLADAQHAIEKTRVTAPFRGRVAALNAEQGQFIRTGERVLELQDISAAEITAEIQPSSFAPLISLALRNEAQPNAAIDTAAAVDMLRAAGITAEVSLTQASIEARWPSEIVRLRGTMDSDTGSFGLIVRVENPLMSRQIMGQPPLNPGMFVAVKLSTRPVEDVLTVPRQAIRFDDQGAPFAYLLSEGNRLGRSELQLGPVLDSEVVVLGGLSPGDTIVLSNPQPPVIGMALEPVAEIGAN